MTMQEPEYAVAVVGGGPAGMAAALAAAERGGRVLVVERNPRLGGILRQCIHDGFGLIRFREQLTGPEYAGRYGELVRASGVDVLTGAMAIRLTPERELTCVTRAGVQTLRAGAVVLATGCRERTRGALGLPGDRPAGIYTAGVAQHLVNIQNIRIGSRAVILGSGDIGMIMARRLTLEGLEVLCVLEKLPYCSGLPRNRRQCLEDFGIPLRLRQTVREIRGKTRVERIVAAQVDEHGAFVPGTDREIDCDTLVLSVGLIPENELARDCGIVMDPGTGGCRVSGRLETSVSGVFACGNALHVHDLVDYVSEEGELAGKCAADFAAGGQAPPRTLPVRAAGGLRALTPQCAVPGEGLTLSARPAAPGEHQVLRVRAGDRVLARRSYVRVNPAEMLRLDVPPAPADAEEIEVELLDR